MKKGLTPADDGRIVIRTSITLYPGRHDRIIEALQQSRLPTSKAILSLMETGVGEEVQITGDIELTLPDLAEEL